MKTRLSIFLLVAACGGVCATRALPPGDARRGEAVFRTRNCIVCHSMAGQGGTAAPDLGKTAERGFSPSLMAGLLWNHAPVMWSAMGKAGVPIPELPEQEGADLFVYLFAARYFERPGDPGRGERLFRQKRCADCHGLTAAPRENIKPVSEWSSLADPIELAQRMWNHSREMKPVLDRKRIPYPRLSAQELTDVLVYVRSSHAVAGRPVAFSPGQTDSGEKLFATKGCAGCHRGALSLEARPTRYSLTEFAAAMWNHSFQPQALTPLTHEEMRGLAGYLIAMQFFEERGDPVRGRKVFTAKRCDACHDNPSSGAPGRRQMAGRMTSFGIVAALWKHGPTMLNRMRLQKIAWPRFNGTEMADLTAYLHGYQLRKRALVRDADRQ